MEASTTTPYLQMYGFRVKRDLIILLLFIFSAPFLFLFLMKPRGESNPVIAVLGDFNLKLIENATTIGATCLDGSPPGYYLRTGKGNGTSRWLIFLEGGGWCATIEDCYKRSLTRLGSSEPWLPMGLFEGIFSPSEKENPDFHNWNVAHVKYCDGGSFSGHVNKTVTFKGKELYFRGSRIFQAIVADLLRSGMNESSEVLLGGCSAGGLGSLLQCDNLKAKLPPASKLKCFSDAGLFLDAADLQGNHTLRTKFQMVSTIHNVQMGSACLSARSAADSWQCFFPEHIVKYIKQPLFLVNSLYDTWQIANAFVPQEFHRNWTDCIGWNPVCSASHGQILGRYRQEMIDKFSAVLERPLSGGFLDSCFTHCQTVDKIQWHSNKGPKLPLAENSTSRMTVAEALGDWYYERRRVVLVDLPFPNNANCSQE